MSKLSARIKELNEPERVCSFCDDRIAKFTIEGSNICGNCVYTMEQGARLATEDILELIDQMYGTLAWTSKETVKNKIKERLE